MKADIRVPSENLHDGALPYGWVVLMAWYSRVLLSADAPKYNVKALPALVCRSSRRVL